MIPLSSSQFAFESRSSLHLPFQLSHSLAFPFPLSSAPDSSVSAMAPFTPCFRSQYHTVLPPTPYLTTHSLPWRTRGNSHQSVHTRVYPPIPLIAANLIFLPWLLPSLPHTSSISFTTPFPRRLMAFFFLCDFTKRALLVHMLLSIRLRVLPAGMLCVLFSRELPRVKCWYLVFIDIVRHPVWLLVRRMYTHLC